MKDENKTAIDKVCEEFMNEQLKLSSIYATEVGLEDRNPTPDVLDDFSPESNEEYLKVLRSSLAKARATDSVTPTDEIVKKQLIDSIETEITVRDDFQDPIRDLNNISSPSQAIRMVFERLPKETPEDIAKIQRKLDSVPASIDSYIESLQKGYEANHMPAIRQVRWVAKESHELGNPASSQFNNLGVDASKAIAAFEKLASYLDGDYQSKAVEDDACGEERYKVYANQYSGIKLDTDETFEWGVSEFERIVNEKFEIAKRVLDDDLDGSNLQTKLRAVKAAADKLDSRPEQALPNKEELLAYMKETSGAAMKFLIDGNYFDIPEPMRTLECQIAPSHSGEIYYTQPTDGFKIPGSMWWSVPEGANKFFKWREKTTIHHEGVPGHHLQCSMPVYLKDELNDYRRFGMFLSGYAEGWALYAEQLMDEFGFLDEPAKFGQLDGQMLRSGRIVIDIGVHCQKRVPKSWEGIYGEGVITWDKAWNIIDDATAMSEGFRLFELTRYMGWPGQAIAYKLGHRKFVQLRDKALEKGWSLFDYHKKVLNYGCIGLDLLEEALFS